MDVMKRKRRAHFMKYSEKAPTDRVFSSVFPKFICFAAFYKVGAPIAWLVKVKRQDNAGCD